MLVVKEAWWLAVKGKVTGPDRFGWLSGKMLVVKCPNQVKRVDWLNLVAIRISILVTVLELEKSDRLNFNPGILFKFTLNGLDKGFTILHVATWESPITSICPLLQQHSPLVIYQCS